MEENFIHKVCDCNIPAELQKDKMFEAIAAYLEGLAPAECVDDKTYEERLAICAECDGRVGPTCRYCGCFVLARAKKINQECPKPGMKLW